MALPSGRRPRKPFADAGPGVCRICGKPSAKRDHDACLDWWRWTDPKFYRPKILERDGNRCEHCGGVFPDGDLQVDHILALVNGGSHGHPALYQTLCAPRDGGGCHRRKSAWERRAERKERAMGSKVLGWTVLVAVAVMWVTYLRVPYQSQVLLVAGAGYVLLGGWWLVRRVGGVRSDRHRSLHELLVERTGVPVSRVSATRAVWRDGAPVRVTHRYSPVVFSPSEEVLAEMAKALSRMYGVALMVRVGVARGVPVLEVSRGSHVPPPVRDCSMESLSVKLSGVVGGDVVTDVRFVDDEPAVLTVKYPAVFPADEAGQQKVFDLIQRGMDGRWRLEWDFKADTVTAFRRPPMPDRVDRPVVKDPSVVPLGIGEDGQRADWVPDVQAHLLVAGETGSGKSVTVSGVILHCLANGWDAVVADGKGTTLAGFERWPGVIASGFGQAKAMNDALVMAERMMDRRYADIRAGKVKAKELRRLLVVIDEATLMMARLEVWWAQERGRGDPRVPPGVQAWKNIAVAGREARIHLMMGIQQAAAGDFDGTQIRDQFGARVALGPTSPESARMMFKQGHVGRDVPAGARGRATVALARSVGEVQMFYSPELAPDGSALDEDLEGEVRRWRHLAGTSHPLHVTRGRKVHAGEVCPGQKVLVDGDWVLVSSVDAAGDGVDDEIEFVDADGRHAGPFRPDQVVSVLDSE